MEDILVSAFLKILNLSITGGYIILAVMLARLILRRAPKKYSYALWAVALFRLVCPVSFKSVISVFALRPFDVKLEDTALSSQTAEIVHIPENIGMMAQPEIQTGITAVDAAVNESLPGATPMYSANPLQIWEFFGMLLWLAGIAALLAISLIGLWRLCRRLRTATLLQGNVWQSENVRSPFIIGLFKPKIYIPYGLEGAALGYVLAHERSHIKRGDHIIRTLAYLVLCLHWFNPLVWLAFWLAGRDMELSCDEKVLSRMGGKAEYSKTLLSFASPRRFPAPTPLAFGESGVGRRIKNALKWKRPRLWVSVVALVLCTVVIAACAANPKDESEQSPVSEKTEKDELWGDWVSVDYENLMRLSSSSYFNGDNERIYRISETEGLTVHSHVMPDVVNESYKADWGWQEFPYTDGEWERMAERYSYYFSSSISEMYDEILYQPLVARTDDATVFWMEYPYDNFLLSLDGNIKMVYLQKDADGGDIISDIVSLERMESLGTAGFSYEPNKTSGEPGIEIYFPGAGDVEYLNPLGSVEVYNAEGARFPEGEIVHPDGQSTSGHIPTGGKLFWSPANKTVGGTEVCSNGTVSLSINGFSFGDVYINSENGIYKLSTAGAYTRLEQNTDGSVSVVFIEDDVLSSADTLANGSPWKLLTELDANNVGYFGITGAMVDADISGLGIRESIIDALRNVRPDEIKVGRGIPWRYSIDIGCGPSDVITLGYGRDFVELRLSEGLKEMYPAERGVWEIHNTALTELMAGLEAKPFAEFELNDTDEVKILFDIPGVDLVNYVWQTEAFPVGNSVYSSSYSGNLFGEEGTLLWAPYVERNGSAYPAERGEISVNIWRDNDFIQGWLNFRCSQSGDTTHCKAYASGDVTARLDEATGQIIVSSVGEFRPGMYEYISGLRAKDLKVVGINPTELNEALPDDLNETVAEAFGKIRASELSIGGGVIFEAELALETPEGSLSLLYDGDKVMLDLAGELEKKYSGIVGRWMIDSPAIRSLFDSILSGVETGAWNTEGADIFGESNVFSYADMRAAIDRVLTHMSFNPPSADVKLLRLGYDEELSLRKAPDFAKRYGADEAIVLVSDFEVGKSWGAFNPNSTYTDYEWVLVRDIGGDWALKTWGYG